MQVRRWDPFTVLARPLAQIDKDFDELVRRTVGDAGTALAGRSGFVPACEVVRDGSDVIVRLELPGLDVERDVTIEVERGRLVVAGERRDEREGEAAVLVRELRYGAFRREFALPPGTSPEQVEASYDSGLLDVRVRAVVTPEPQPVRVPVTRGTLREEQTALEADA